MAPSEAPDFVRSKFCVGSWPGISIFPKPRVYHRLDLKTKRVRGAMILLRTLACVAAVGSILAALAASPTLAQTVKNQSEAADPTTIESVARSLENTAHGLEKTGGLRGSNMQWHAPADAAEYQALAKYVPVLVVVVSQDKAELPLRRVYVDGGNGEATELTRISSVRSVDPKSFTANILGRNRETSYYLLPVALLSRHGRVIADFAINRTGYQLATLDDNELDYVKADSDPLPSPGSTPDRAALHDFVERHFKNIPLRD
jgi:hypothetical protein